VDIEVDEICSRSKWARDSDNNYGKEWLRYIAAMERNGDNRVLMSYRPDSHVGQGRSANFAPVTLIQSS
jgi:hypothetical protein